ncbi:hypothetical protein Pmar_PMAR019824 [Perkinsus marinus ATCC 50983]|uniref:Uncharacterized protein n=1 Tax=Perkinsus marinus (strain ATCC 50983 / TXsc) TaxID=423536 RepID=C5M0X7_PERM5|nr:hypothetical protein Pmar_PMAR019824 [Perkinsus marinus ATCC 50983]EEQ97365.1 hypothetical protein Pmar_PMAR019824 [Perkinsus marinus ATCC 50983]|eukprot:XP_002764648.1 hypothetical protein Pmar_PMAR019824 [Perkinsus marinus ATCC 50983]
MDVSLISAAGNDSILEHTPGADDVSLRLNWRSGVESALVKDRGAAQAVQATSAGDMTYNHHDWGVWVDQLSSFPEAEKNFKVLATSTSTEVDREFIAVVEGRNEFDGVWAVQVILKLTIL